MRIIVQVMCYVCIPNLNTNRLSPINNYNEDATTKLESTYIMTESYQKKVHASTQLIF